MKVHIYITLKKAVLDPQGKAVKHALLSLGYNEVSDVRIGKYIEIELSGTDTSEVERKVEEMCRKLLANTVIEDYRYEVAR